MPIGVSRMIARWCLTPSTTLPAGVVVVCVAGPAAGGGELVLGGLARSASLFSDGGKVIHLLVEYGLYNDTQPTYHKGITKIRLGTGAVSGGNRRRVPA